MTILSLRKILKNHVLNLATMDTVNLEINVGTLILSNLTIISNIINGCTRNAGPGGLCEGHDRVPKTCWTSSCFDRVSSTGSATLPTRGLGTYGFSRFSAALGGHKTHKRIRRVKGVKIRL